MSTERNVWDDVRRWWWEKAVPALSVPCIRACAVILVVLVLILIARLIGLLSWDIHWDIVYSCAEHGAT